MNPRVKQILTIIVLCSLPVFAYKLPYAWYSSLVSARTKQIDDLELTLAKQQRELERGKRSQQQIQKLEERSLPYDKENPARPRSLYQAWLLGAIAKAGLEDPKVDPLQTQDKKAYQAHGFTVSGKCTLAQLTQFLYDFYSAPHLHTIRSLRIKPAKEKSKELEVTVTLEAIGLSGATDVKGLPQGQFKRLAEADVKTYVNDIVGRNLFGPPNAAPKISSLGTQRAYLGRPFSVTVRASDSDKDDHLTYSLEPGAPAGARVDAKSGEFRFSPTAKGTFHAAVRVADSGMPSKSDVAKFEITVTDPPPPPAPVAEAPKKLSFDAARYTVVIGTFPDPNGVAEVWLKVRTTDQTLKLHEGDKIDIGGFQGHVVRIDGQDVEIKSGNRRYLVSLGDSLDQAQPLPSGDL